MLAKKLESAAKAVESAYIEDVFSTYLYTGNGSTQTITNGIDLSTKGGLVWIKSRTNSAGTGRHSLWDTARGRDKTIIIDVVAQDTGIGAGAGVTSFNTNGFSLGTPYYETNISSDSVASWTFRNQPKFFTCGTFTGDGTTNKVITHDLNGTTGCIIVKRTDSTGNWQTWHRTFTTKQTIFLNTIDAVQTYSGADAITVTDNSFTVGTNQIFGNGSGFTYVYYVFAHNAGGFGASGNDNVITCGSYVGNGSTTGPVITLGYEPQWLLVKSATDATDWFVVDTMREFWTGDTTTTSHNRRLKPNTGDAESLTGFVIPKATGFQIYGVNGTATAYNASGSTYIYIAIRKGPMKVPTTGTSVFSPNVSSAATGTAVTTGFPIDLQIQDYRTTPSSNFVDRLRSFSSTSTDNGAYVRSVNTNAEASGGVSLNWNNTSFQIPSSFGSADTVYYNFRRAPGFFDEVCYAGNSTDGRTVSHNLTIAPELIIVKARNTTSGSNNWIVGTLFGASSYRYGFLNATSAVNSSTYNLYFSAQPTISTFTLFGTTGSYQDVNEAGVNYVAYLFASCPGVSKVGSYTGNGSSQTINCGFTGGARFVLIKRTDTTGDWYVWDTARGIVSGNDPHLSLNTTAAEVTTDDTIDPDSTGFIVNQLSATNVNVSSANYIYLAIA